MVDGTIPADESEPVEVAMAHDSLEAIFWVKQLEGLGIQTEIGA